MGGVFELGVVDGWVEEKSDLGESGRSCGPGARPAPLHRKRLRKGG